MSDKTNVFWEKNIETKNIPNNEVNFDAIIVGGGPAGSAAACYAANEGFKVLLLEKEEFLVKMVSKLSVLEVFFQKLLEVNILKF